MRIVHVTEYLHPSIGGIETEVLQISSLAAATGHDVSVITPMRQNAKTYEELKGIKIIRTKSFRNSFKIFRMCNKADIVHIHGVAFPSLLVEKIKHERTVVSLYDWGHICPKGVAFQPKKHSICVYRFSQSLKCFKCKAYSQWKRAFSPYKFLYMIQSYFFLSWPRVITVMSEAMRKAYFEATHRNDIKVIPGGVDVHGFDQVDPGNILQEIGVKESPTILFVGRPVWLKGIECLIEATAKLNKNVKIIVAGPYFPMLRNFAKSIDVHTRVIFTGGISLQMRKKLIQLYKACDVVVIPSVWEEPFGIVALEAMAAGKPVIASRVGGLVEIVNDGKTGFLVEPRDSNQLAKAIEKLLSDKKLRESFGRAGYEKAKKYDWKEITDSFLNIYKSISEVRS